MKDEESSQKNDAAPVTLVVVGASGDLARKKVVPALFALYCQGFLPARFSIFGFARTALSTEQFRALLMEHLTCRYVPGESCAERMDEFLSRCFYVRGQYDSRDAFLDLYSEMRLVEEDSWANRIFYMAIPPSLFLDVSRALGDAGLVSCGDRPGWSRVVIEKPFGRDRESSDTLAESMAQVFTEEQTFRIDHYLHKEVVQDLLVLRFANPIFDPIWNRTHIHSVTVSWKEDMGVGDRGGYFDAYGILRDVMQNHLLQIVALVAMEQPASLNPNDIRDAKVKVLSSIAPVRLCDVVLGQYQGAVLGGVSYPSYVDEKGIPAGSLTPTYAAVVLHLENARWRGVPFLLQAGKGLDARMTEIRIRFREAAGNIFCETGSCPARNELIVRVQPDESIALRITNKLPGLTMALGETKLDLRYASAFGATIPDAYESLLLDVLQGDKSLFIRADELAAAWDVFTPLLHELEKTTSRPEPYGFGSTGPQAAKALAERY